MRIKTAVASRFLADDAIKQITTKIYRGRLPIGGKPPSIIIEQSGKNRIYDHDGYSGLTEGYLRIWCHSTDPDEADEMAALVQESLELWPGETADIDKVEIDDETDDFNQETLTEGVYLDVTISYHE